MLQGQNNISENILNENVVMLLPFSLIAEDQEIRFFVNTQKILRVVEPDNLTPFPGVDPLLVGIYDMDNIPVPIIDLTKYWQEKKMPNLNISSSKSYTTIAKKNNRRILICHIMNFYIGFLVDHTRKIFRQLSAEIQPPPKLLDLLETNLISAVVRDDKGFLYMFDIENFLQTQLHLLQITNTKGTPSPLLTGKTILFVDDSSYFQKLGRSVLEKYGAAVNIAENGKIALEMLLENPKKFDLIMTDIEMPIMNGIEMARMIKQQAALNIIPLIFHSSIANPALMDEAKGLGSYLLKFDETNLIEKISSLLGNLSLR